MTDKMERERSAVIDFQISMPCSSFLVKIYNLRQGPKLQGSVFSVAPVQGSPPYCGRGFVQVLVNVFSPHPHVVLQPCAFQPVKPPSIAK